MGKKVDRVSIPCEVCGKAILVTAAEARRRPKLRFCSKKCSGKGKDRGRHSRKKKICVVCGAVFEVQPSLEKQYSTCSKECSGKYRSRYGRVRRQFCNVSEMIRLYNDGLSQAAIAEKMGTVPTLIWMRLKEAGIKCRDNSKGDDVTYQMFHMRVVALRGKPAKCDVCGVEDPNKYYAWANLTGKYNDPNDYKRMCGSCHWEYDHTERKSMKGEIYEIQENQNQGSQNLY